MADDVTITSLDDLAGTLSEARAILEWSQSDVAAAAGLSKSEISKLESGSRVPNLSSLLQWTSALGVEIRLAYGDDSPVVAALGRRALRSRTIERLANGDAGRIRTAAGVTCTALGEVLECGHVSIRRWETDGRPPRGDALLMKYGAILDDLAEGKGLPSARSFGHDMLGVRLDNTLRRHGISREQAIAMSDEDLSLIPEMGAGSIRRIREHATPGSE